MAFSKMRDRLDAGEIVYSAWMTMPCEGAAGALGAASWDAVMIDMQHGQIGYMQMAAMVRAIAGAGNAAIVRVPIGDGGMIGRALDAGASAIICPMVNTVADAKWFSQAAKYPPIGARSFAPMPVTKVMGEESSAYLTGANRNTLTWAMIESGPALEALDDIIAVDGIDGVFVGPRDLIVSLSGGAHDNTSDPQALEAAASVATRAREKGAFAGIYAATPELARKYREFGFGYIALGNDAGYLAAGSAALLNQAGA